MNSPHEPRIFFESRAPIARREDGLTYAIGKRSSDRLLARVHEPEPAIGAIAVEVGFVRDKHGAGAVGDVSVVGHVDEKMIGDELSLNPRMEDGDELVRL